MTPQPATMTCAACLAPRGTATHPAGTTTHLPDGPADHPPLPVPPGILTPEPHCDFCGGPDPTWTLPARDFAWHPGGARRDSRGDWGACWACASFIAQDRWHALARHAVAAANRRHQRIPHPDRDHAVAASLLNLWALVRQHTTGPIQPTREAAP